MLKKSVMFILAVMFIGTIPVYAMGGGCSGGQSGSMQSHMDDMMGNGAYERMHNGNWQSIHGDSGMGMTGQVAETMMRCYMEEKNIDSWQLGTQLDHGSYYMNDVIGPNGEVIDRLTIDKKSGKIHSVDHRG